MAFLFRENLRHGTDGETDGMKQRGRDGGRRAAYCNKCSQILFRSSGDPQTH